MPATVDLDSYEPGPKVGSCWQSPCVEIAEDERFPMETIAVRGRSPIPPPYSTDIKAAWEIVEHVGGHSSWSMYWLGGPDEKKFWRVCIIGNEYVDAPTAPRAICEAFLKLP